MGMQLYTPVLEQHLTAVEAALPNFLPSAGGLQDTVVHAMAYACSAGGKRLRPVLTLEFCRLCGGEPERALPFACAVEMIHSYSLVHDDLPCMDNSALRRGKPSTHVAYGEDMALLAGDALLNRAFETMLRVRNLPAERVLAAAGVLADAAGIEGMVGGQVIDLESEKKPIPLETLEALQMGKTAALIRAACEMGSLVAGAPSEQQEAARAYGTALGLCFQIVDDILDVTATAEQLGKPTGSDSENQKSTYVSLLGLDEARRLAQQRTEQARQALSLFGKQAEDLRQLATALQNRRK